MTSFATYELIGSFDLLVRFYMQPEREKEFVDAYEDALKPHELSNALPFRVEEIPRHWVWAGGPGKGGALERPSKEVLKRHYSRAQIELLNRANARSHERQALIKHFTELGLVTSRAGCEGVKFVVTIGTHDEIGGELRKRLRRRLETTLDKASGVVRERSLYTGELGQRELFLVMCRIKQGSFQRVRTDFLEPLGAAAAMADASTTTYPVVSDDFLCFQDELAVPDPPQPDVHSLLQGHESGQFEVKGSLAAPLDPWLRDGIPLEQLAASKSYPLRGVLKSVVGLLNSGGGTVVIGAIEEASYAKDTAASGRLRALPKVGLYRIVGLVDPSFRKGGWDSWDRQLRSLIREKIDPNPGVLVQPREIEVEGRTICAIDIDDPGDEGEFYLRTSKATSQFFGREGTQVHPLTGSQIARHRDQVRKRRANTRKLG